MYIIILFCLLDISECICIKFVSIILLLYFMIPYDIVPLCVHLFPMVSFKEFK